MELTNPTGTPLPSWASELIPDLHDAIWSGGGHHDHAAWQVLEVLQRRGLLVQNETEGVTTRELQWPPSVAQGCHEAAAEAEPGSPMQQLLVAAGDLLESYARPTIKPVPVAERLPGLTKYSEDFWRKNALEQLVHAATSFRCGVYSAEELEIFENRARFFLARWGRPAIEPLPQQPS